MALSAQADTVQKDGIRVHFDANLAPRALPRSTQAPVEVDFVATLATTQGAAPPQLRRITLAINRYGRLNRGGLPVCSFKQIQPTTTADALAACGPSLVGEGKFTAKILIPDQATFPQAGKVLAFNGVVGCAPSELALLEPFRSPSGRGWPSSSRTQGGRGGERAPARDPNLTDRGQRDAQCHPRPAILAHVFGTQPVPTSFTLPFTIGHGKGTFATVLRASLPAVTGNAGYVTGLSMTLGKTFSSHGAEHGYLSASCPAPSGFPGAVFPLARGSFLFAGKKTLTSTLTRSCKALPG